MKLKFLFILIIFYVIGGFGWWSYSLIQFSRNEYNLKLKLLESGVQTCEMKLIEEARSHKFITPKADSFVIRDIAVVMDKEKAGVYIRSTFSDRYLIKYAQHKGDKVAQVVINKQTQKRLKKELTSKIRSFALEAMILTLLIAAGIFGVYFSVSLVFDLNKQQNNFLLSVTHELKTPIAAIKLMGETMKRRVLPQEKQAELMDIILENAVRLQDMTENMLTAMQMENRKYKLQTEELNLSDLLSGIKKSFAHKNEIFGKIEAGHHFFGDPFLLKMTFNNLIENAIKYSHNRPVEINLYKRDKNLVIEVADQGIGIPPAMHKKIFRKFYRIQDDETRETKGSGLGLFIVKQAVEKHKGSIKIKNNLPSGTVFTIVFPAMS